MLCCLFDPPLWCLFYASGNRLKRPQSKAFNKLLLSFYYIAETEVRNETVEENLINYRDHKAHI